MHGHRFSYAANLSIMFTEYEFLARPAAARAAGFTMIEMWWPFAEPVAEPEQVDALVGAIEAAEVRLIGLNFFGGDLAAGQRGVASHPAAAGDLAANAEQVAAIARRTGCRNFNLLYGQRDDRWSVPEQEEAAIEAIRNAAAVVAPFGGTVLLEPLAAGLNGAYPLTTTDEVTAVIDAVAAPADNVRLLFDVFHLGSNGADLVAEASRQGGRIGHVQLADSPGRGEPGSGTLPIAAALAALPDDYPGVIACEYRPTRRTEETLDWIATVDGPPAAGPDL
ncbi:TIM barrel protein [Microlunatus parietis]|uniref:Hydroxypyruvate isomerase n=1 Tax=Microlunatus parietis TaxID=682979 RepID=A0A7Y9I7G3_9ACTN|nr:TIM barrel protein [Microlunatus parietis]NYE71470.1 hydroxypyruvate isomerase [Microlunatus parietis]